MAAAKKKGGGKAKAASKKTGKKLPKKPGKKRKRRIRHGTRSAYVNDKCRCPKCRAANAKFHAERRNGSKDALPPKTPASTSAEKSIRDTMIVARKAQGWPWEAIAKEAGISERAAQEAHAKRIAAMPDLLEQDAISILNGLVDGLQLSIGDLEQLANAALAERNMSAAVQAKRGANDAREKLQTLLQTTGLLPQDLGTIRHVVEFRGVIVQLVDTVAGFVREIEALPLPEAQRTPVLAAADTVRERLELMDGGATPTNGGSDDG